MELIFDYMKNDILRYGLNALAQKTFGIDFENWMTGGYFDGAYLPYSFMEDGKILANVSANRMKFVQNGVYKYYIQVGTVMTDQAYRKHGLARKLMEHILEEYENKCDGIYLFSAPSAVGFYKKMGFQEGVEYRYSLKKDCTIGGKENAAFRKTDERDEQVKQKYVDTVKHCAVNSALEQINKFGLQMFYTADLHEVYYMEDLDCFAIMEKMEDTLMLKSIVSRQHISMRDIISHIPAEYRALQLGFSPCAEDVCMFEASVYDDNHFFYRGKDLESIEKEKLFFPELSHA